MRCLLAQRHYVGASSLTAPRVDIPPTSETRQSSGGSSTGRSSTHALWTYSPHRMLHSQPPPSKTSYPPTRRSLRCITLPIHNQRCQAISHTSQSNCSAEMVMECLPINRAVHPIPR